MANKHLILLCGIILLFSNAIGQWDDNHEVDSFAADIKVKLFDESVNMELQFDVIPVRLRSGAMMKSLFIQRLKTSSKHLQQVDTGTNSHHLLQLQRRLYFAQTEDGLIKAIYHGTDETMEVLNLKKSLLAMLSSNIRINATGRDGFSHHEYDHTGYHPHLYHVSEENGLVKTTKNKNSTQHSSRRTLLHDRRGKLQRAYGTERFGHSSGHNVFPGLKSTSEHNAEFDIHLVTRRTITKVSFIDDKMLRQMTKSSLVINNRPAKQKITWRDLEIKVAKAVRCALDKMSHEEADSECVYHLSVTFRDISSSLLAKFAAKRILNSCAEEGLNPCMQTKMIIVRALGRSNTLIAQNMIIRFLKIIDLEKSEKKRVLQLLPKQDEATKESISYLHKQCFGVDNSSHGILAIEELQMTSCLVLGSMLSKLNSDSDEVNERLGKIHQWLNESADYTHVMKEQTSRVIQTNARSILIHMLGNINHPHSVAVLTQHLEDQSNHDIVRRSAANALRKYTCAESATALLNSTINDMSFSVRRSAFHVYNEHPLAHELTMTQENLLESKVQEGKLRNKRASVRNTIDMLSFAARQKITNDEWTRQNGNEELGFKAKGSREASSEFEASPVYTRAKTTTFIKQSLDGWINAEGLYKFNVMAVELCSDKEFRFYNSNILSDHNMEAYISKVEAFDEKFKEFFHPLVQSVNAFYGLLDEHTSTLGHISLDRPIIWQKMCSIDFCKSGELRAVFEDHMTFIEAELNDLLQDNIVDHHALDNCVLENMDSDRFINEIDILSVAITECVQNTSNIYEKPIGIMGKINFLILTVQNLYYSLDKITESATDFRLYIEYLSSQEIHYHFGPLVRQLVAFVEDVYSDLVDCDQVLEQEIYDNFAFFTSEIDGLISIMERAIHELHELPQTAITSIQFITKSIKEALVVYSTSKNRLSQTLSIVQGKLRTWMGPGAEFRNVRSNIMRYTDKVVSDLGPIPGSNTSQRDTLKYTIIQKRLAEEIQAKLLVIIEDLDKVQYISDNFTVTMWQIDDVLTSVSTEFEKLFTRVEAASIHVQRSFGLRFASTFPRQVRTQCNEECGCGIYPNVLNGRHGVQLLIEAGQKITAPVMGLLKSTQEPNTAIIYPLASDMVDYEIVLSYIDLNETIARQKDGQYVLADSVIGTSTMSPCQPNYLHMAIRLRNSTDPNGSTEGEGGIYSKADAFYDKPDATQVYLEDGCNSLEWKHENEYIDIVDLSMKFEQEKKTIKRAYEIISDDIIPHKKIEADFDDNITNTAEMFYQLTPFITTYLHDLQQSTFSPTYKILPTFENRERQSTIQFDSDTRIPKPGDYFDLLKGYTFNETIQFLRQSNMDELADELIEAMNLMIHYINLPIQSPIETVKDIKLRAMSSHYGWKLDTNRDDIISSTLRSGLEGCEQHLGIFPNGFKCRVEGGCHTIQCLIEIDIGENKLYQDVVLRHIDDNMVFLQFMNTSATFLHNGTDIQDVMPVYIDNSTVNFVLNVYSMNKDLMLSLDVITCSLPDSSCRNPLSVFKHLSLIGNTSAGARLSTVSADPDLWSFMYGDYTRSIRNGFYPGRTLSDLMKKFGKSVQERADAVRRIVFDGKKGKRVFCPFMIIILYCNDKGFEIKPEFDEISGETIYVQSEMDLWYDLRVSTFTCTVDFHTSSITKIAMDGETELHDPYVKTRLQADMELTIEKFKAAITLFGIGYALKDYSSHPITGVAEILTEFNLLSGNLCVNMTIDFIPTCMHMWHCVKMLFVEVPVLPSMLGCLEPESEIVLTNICTEVNLTEIPVYYEITNEMESTCKAKQQFGRPVEYPMVTLDSVYYDTSGPLIQEFAIGKAKGSTDMAEWTVYQGGVQLINIRQESETAPAFITTRSTNARNSMQTAFCTGTYIDETPPTGRVDLAHYQTSFPSEIHGMLSVVDESDLAKDQFVAVGSGKFTDNLVSRHEFYFTYDVRNNEAEGVLSEFTDGKSGRLNNLPLFTTSVTSDSLCAEQCLDFGDQCKSFDYEYETGACILHNVIAGYDVQLVSSGSFFYFERLGAGLYAYFSFIGLNLTHGASYYINSYITNDKGFSSVISSQPIVVDFSPPEPGTIENEEEDFLRHDNCSASVTHGERCQHVTPNPNHRVIKDGPGSKTVFNGNQIGRDLLFSAANHYIAGCWDGFHDDETGIWGYTWAVGTCPCGSDVQEYEDPHSHLADSSYWTHQGLASDLLLEDGAYFVTVQALNNIVFGGALVTTVCHSTPLVIDTTPPVIHYVDNVLFDASFSLLGIYYSASDEESGIARTDIGLGETKHDVLVLPYTYHEPLRDGYEMVSIDDVDLPVGVAMYVRIRVANNVELLTSAHGEQPIMVDPTSPIAGQVLDGDILHQDLMYQSYNDRLCVQWIDWFDPESGIDRYLWGIGTVPNLTDVAEFITLNEHQFEACTNIQLSQNETYYSTIIAYNKGINSQSTTKASTGVTVDMTPPSAGWVVDGLREDNILFSSEAASVYAHWGDFIDYESDIYEYSVTVYINGISGEKYQVAGSVNSFEDHTQHFSHSDKIHVSVEGRNGAGLTASSSSSGYVIDMTQPVVKYIDDHPNRSFFQTNNTHMFISWQFVDPESSIQKYEVVILEYFQGHHSKFWPNDKEFITYIPDYDNKCKVTDIIEAPLVNGRKYVLEVVAYNNAGLNSKHRSKGTTVDTTPPVMVSVYVGAFGVDENINSEGQIIHMDQHGIHASWSGFDHESDIHSYLVAVGTSPTDGSITQGYRNYGSATSAYIDGLSLHVDNIYYINVVAINNANANSTIMSSKPIYVYQDNIAGVVFDGRNLFEDRDFTREKKSFAMSFMGFESDACGIVGYDWALGNSPGYSDIVPFSSYGIVMMNETHGYAEVHLELTHGMEVYATVRAYTGHKCHESSIESSSNGIIIDNEPPKVVIQSIGVHDIIKTPTLYQQQSDSIQLEWNSTDPDSGVLSDSWMAGSLPFMSDMFNKTMQSNGEVPVGDITMEAGESICFSLNTYDNAGNLALTLTPYITIDQTPPSFHGSFTCTEYISRVYPIIHCTWDDPIDLESPIESIMLGIGHVQFDDSVASFEDISNEINTWNIVIDCIFDATIPMKDLMVTIKVTNKVGLYTAKFQKVIVDESPPEVGTLEITTPLNPSDPPVTKICQMSTSTIMINIGGFKEEQSRIESYEFGIGSERGASDLHRFQTIGNETEVFLSNLTLRPGSVVYPVVRAINSARLVSETVSVKLYISPTTSMTVFDGLEDKDIDFQNDLTTISGQFTMNNVCPIIECKWHFEDLSGHMVTNDTVCHQEQFQNDEVILDNFNTYVLFVNVKDAQNRTILGRSNGVMTAVEPPIPGEVRDGPYIDEDWDYQERSDELSYNWDVFGTTDKWQEILYYEVAVGTNPALESTRSDVHYFVNVGLNLTYTFTNLHLQEKTVTYYGTVKAHSISRAYTESTTSGIKVGYEEIIHSQNVYIQEYLGSTSSLQVSWDEFISDFKMRGYFWGVSNKEFKMSNQTLDCHILKNRFSKWSTEMKIRYAGLDTIDKVDFLNLSHNDVYFVTILGQSEGGLCKAAPSLSFKVDITPPILGNVVVGGLSDYVQYVTNNDRLEMNLDKCFDDESGIKSTLLQLYRHTDCEGASVPIPITSEIDIGDKLHYTFLDVSLMENLVYTISVTMYNNANLSSHMESQAIFLDTTAPEGGSVYFGSDYTDPVLYQSSPHEVNGTLALAPFRTETNCSMKHTVIPGNLAELISIGDKNMYHIGTKRKPRNHYMTYNEWNLKSGPEQTYVKMTMATNTSTGILDSAALKVEDTNILDGDYTFKVHLSKTSITEPAILSFALLQKMFHEHIEFDLPEVVETLSDEDFLAQGDVIENEESVTEDYTTTNSMNSTTEKEMPYDNGTNVFNSDSFSSLGIGFHILSFPLGNKSEVWKVLFWTRDYLGIRSIWGDISADPTKTPLTYVMRMKTLSPENVRVTLIVDNVFQGTFESVVLKPNMKLAVRYWSHDETVPAIQNPFNPFECHSLVSILEMPVEKTKLCHYGEAFVDQESGIKSIEIALMSFSPYTRSHNTSDSQIMEICHSCLTDCDTLKCDINCEWLIEDLYYINRLYISNLSMEPGIYAYDDDDELQFYSFYHYLEVNVINEAGLTTVARSNILRIDTTPPLLKFLDPFDPDYIPGSPAEFQSSNASLAAVWEFNDLESPIIEYRLSVGTDPFNSNVVEEFSFGLETEAIISELPSTLSYGTKYFVNVRAINAAGLFTVYHTAGITPIVDKPQMENISNIPYGNDTKYQNNGTELLLTRRKDGMSLNLEGVDKSNLEMLEWSIGTDWNNDFIMSQINVPANMSSVLEIRNDGYVWYTNYNTTISLSHIASHNGQREQILEGEYVDPGTIVLEPGRCLHNHIVGVSKSHEKERMELTPTCITRETDQLISINDGGSFSVQLDTTDVKIEFEEARGTLITGQLYQEDLETVYHNSANLTFSPFVVNPHTTLNATSRDLHNRILGFTGLAFFLTPGSNITGSGPIEISVKQKTKTANIQEDLLYWKQDERKWYACDYFCNASRQENYTQGILFCPSEYEDWILDPVMFASFNISKEQTNMPPTLTNGNLVLQANSAKGKYLTYADPEGDDVEFGISSGAKHGTSNVTMLGYFYYKPNEYFFGLDSIEVVLQETNLAKGVVANTVHDIVDIHVLEVPFSPFLYFAYDIPEDNSDLNIGPADVSAEGNTSISAIGFVYICDYNPNDILGLLRTSSSSNITISTTEEENFIDFDVLPDSCSNNNVKVFHVAIEKEAHLHGIFQARFIAYDSSGKFSEELMVNISVLISPCVHGSCYSTQDPECTSTQRASSFAGYECQCEDWYHGSTCAEFNVWGIALIVLGLVSVIGFVGLTYRFSKRKNRISPQDIMELDDVNESKTVYGVENTGYESQDKAHTEEDNLSDSKLVFFNQATSWLTESTVASEICYDRDRGLDSDTENAALRSVTKEEEESGDETNPSVEVSLKDTQSEDMKLNQSENLEDKTGAETARIKNEPNIDATVTVKERKSRKSRSKARVSKAERQRYSASNFNAW